MNNEVVTPKQQRSIEKRNKIIEAGIHLFSEKGYYHTTTAEIAAAAGVSTGIVYRYFPDKKAIFLEMMQNVYQNFYQGFLYKLKQLSSLNQLNVFLDQVISMIIASHSMDKSVFEEVDALSHYDADVSALVKNANETMINEITAILPSFGIHSPHPHEKLHIVFNLVESYCHEVVYSREECKDYDYLKNLIIETCIHLLEQDD